MQEKNVQTHPGSFGFIWHSAAPAQRERYLQLTSVVKPATERQERFLL